MTRAEVEIRNELGLHLRAAGTFVRTASKFKSQIRVATEGIGAVDGKSILGLVTLGTAKGAMLVLTADGPDEVEAIAALSELVASGFGE
jgi:phosphotransferase system HPr (HPr) family protein